MSGDDNIALGIAVGGTFTDVLALDRASGKIVSAFKVPSTPSDPAEGAIIGVDRYRKKTGGGADAVFHGTTVGTNALITKKGSKTALITTKGFRDVLALRRHARPRLYDLAPKISPVLTPRELRFETLERMGPDGVAITPLTETEIERLIGEIEVADVEAVAISLLHAYANDEHERTLGIALQSALPELFVTLSSDVCREFREFERTSTVVVNAFIGPVVQRYVDALGQSLREREIGNLSIVKSNGGLTSAANARRYPVHLIESGPAAGIIATAALGEAEGLGDLIAFDMGGTTAKVGVVVGGSPKLSTEFYADRFVDGVDVGGYPIQSPVIDLIEIGAGGGSIAWIDAAGVLKVGPESAGALPGPACYGRGGEWVTVTDAHVVLGHIAADGFGSEDLDIDPVLARSAVETNIAGPLGWSVERAAWGVLRLATANMAEMVRLATLRRGLDPRDFSLVAFGGAGPLHAAEIAQEVGVPRVLIPPVPGLFSAIGTMLGDIRHDMVQTHLRRLDDLQSGELDAGFAVLEVRAQDLISAEDGSCVWRHERSVDARFEGQLFELNLPVTTGDAPSTDALDVAFRAAYRETYGYGLPDQTVQLVNLRLVARGAVHDGGWPRLALDTKDAMARSRQVIAEDGSRREVQVWRRDALKEGMSLYGPAIIEDFGATIRLLDGQRLEVHPSGMLELTKQKVAL
jgi:N-methylhydantoinase A